MGKTYADLRLRYSEYLSITNYSRTCLDRIKCTKCIRFHIEKALCNEQFCDVVDSKNRTLYGDSHHLEVNGLVHLQHIYVQLFDELARNHRNL